MQNHAAKFTDDDIRAIRRRYAEAPRYPIGKRSSTVPVGYVTYRMLAEEYGVTQSVIYDIIVGNTWKHVK